jgi:hypothetical protein
MPGGALFGDDFDRLRDSVRRVIDRFIHSSESIRFVEVGTGLGDDAGKTARDLLVEIDNHVLDRVCTPLTFILSYYGIDAFGPDPHLTDKRFIFINELSYKAVQWLPSELHWVFLDGCHCYECVWRDIAVYAPRLVHGGELVFHDASPPGQGREPQDIYPGHQHSPATAAQGIAVRRVLDDVMPNRSGFRMISRAPEEQPLGGVEIYQKVSVP